ncbi:MAG: DUF6502 family protein [Gammaproteobacteria bacterium]
MSDSLKGAVEAAAQRLLEPLVKLLLEAGLGVGECTRILKVAYVRAAREQGRAIAGEARRPNASRISIVTGLTRGEVAAILADENTTPATGDRGRQRAERVLNGWWNDPEFQNETGKPLPLPLNGKRRSVDALCYRYNGERRSGAIVDELLRVRAVRRLPDGRIEPLSRTYATMRWDPEGIAAFGESARELGETLMHNLKHPSRPRLVRRVMNLQLDPRYAPMLIRDLEQQANAFADAADDALNAPQYVARSGPHAVDALRLGVGLYVIEEPAALDMPAAAEDHRPSRSTRAHTARAKRRKGSRRA